MVKEVKFSCDVTRLEPTAYRDAVSDEETRQPVTKRQSKGEAKAAPPVRPVTERRHLAGADWLADYTPLFRKAK